MEEITMTFEARLLMEPYIIENYSKYIDMDKLLDLEEQTKKILSSDILEQKDAVVFCNIDDALHRTIADACKNKYLNMNLSQIYDQNIRIRILGEQPNNSLKAVVKQINNYPFCNSPFIFIYAKPDNYLAGARFSCISQVSLVCTSGVWIVRNFPPQIIIWVKPYLFSFFKYSV